MKKCIMLLLILMLALLAASVTVGASDSDDIIRQQEEALEISETADSLPDDIGNELDDLGIDPESPTSGVKALSVAELFSLLKAKAAAAISLPVKTLALLLCVILLTSLFGGDGDGSRITRTVSLLGAGAAVLYPVIGLASEAAAALSQSSDFILALLPVFVTLTVSGGFPVSSAMMSGSIIFVSRLIVGIASGVLLPLLCMGLSLSAVGAVVPELKTDKTAASVQKGIIWTLGAALAVYLTFLTIQSGLTSSLDALAQKTVKVTVSGAIPIIGSIISEASETVLGAAELIKSGMGTFALVVLLLAFAKPILTAAAWALALRLAETAADAFGSDGIASLTGAVRKTVSVIIALLAAAFTALTVSIAIIVRFRL